MLFHIFGLTSAISTDDCALFVALRGSPGSGLVGVRRRHAVTIMFFLAVTVIKFVVLDQHVTSGAFPLLTWPVLLHVRAIPCPASVKSLLTSFLHSCTALPWPCDGKIDQEILLGMCVWSLSPTTVVCEIRKSRADINHLICLRAKKRQPLRRPPSS